MGTLRQGAHNALTTCLAVKPHEQVLIIADRERIPIARALQREAEKIATGRTQVLVLEDITQRPMKQIPAALRQAIPHVDITIYAAGSMQGEVHTRLQLIRLAVRHARHGHMINITEQLMREGMCADYRQISRLTQRLYQAVRRAQQIHVTNAQGTDLRLHFDSTWRWKPYDGLYHQQGQWGNLPEGEVTTAAKKADGVMVVDELGDYFDRKYGILHKTPVRIEVGNSRANLDTLECRNSKLTRELIQYLQTDANSNRLGEFALGTNTYLKRLVGNLLQDEKLPTAHAAFGDPYPEETGANWTSTTHVDCIMTACTVYADSIKIMENGKYFI